MNRIAASFILTLCLVAQVPAQDTASLSPEQFGLEHLTEYLGLTPEDISYRSDYTEPDEFRFKLVADLMQTPLGMIDYATELKNAHVPGQPEIIAGILFSDMAGEYQTARTRAFRPDVNELKQRYQPYYTNEVLNRLLDKAARHIDIVIPGSTRLSLSQLTSEQRKFLRNEFKELIVVGEDEEFLSVEAIDSLEKVEEQYTEQFVSFGLDIDKDPVTAAGIAVLRDLQLEITALQGELDRGISMKQMLANSGRIASSAYSGGFLGEQEGWAVGGSGNDYYSGDYSFILDFGGNDVYDLTYDPANPHPVVIIDMQGDDYYRAQSDFALGSGCFSVGILIDLAGDDHYNAKSFGLGSGYFGFGLLWDVSGDDRYDGDTHVQGAGTFGLGLLIDDDGRDIYNAALYSQGFGFVEGVGLIYESAGSDSYYAGGKYKDVLRYEEHYLSLSQGFGYGLRPYMSGGVGAIIDLTGNDNYSADIFAQGCAYWWSLGMIYDSSGLDNFQAFQYGQGAATHMALGALINDSGDDVYSGKGLMQGCGHDYSCGLLLDRHGNDTYTAYDLSQAAGSANGAGVLIDNEGDDRYFVKNPANTQGYGNPRRDFGSIGLFIDLGGEDQYLGNGQNDFYWQTNSKWGGGMDIEQKPPEKMAEGE